MVKGRKRQWCGAGRDELGGTVRVAETLMMPACMHDDACMKTDAQHGGPPRDGVKGPHVTDGQGRLSCRRGARGGRRGGRVAIDEALQPTRQEGVQALGCRVAGDRGGSSSVEAKGAGTCRAMSIRPRAALSGATTGRAAGTGSVLAYVAWWRRQAALTLVRRIEGARAGNSGGDVPEGLRLATQAKLTVRDCRGCL